MDKRVHQIRLAQWGQRIIDRQNSGLTIAQWCEQNGFTKDAYYYWQKRVRAAAIDSTGTNLTISSSASEHSLLVPSGESAGFVELSQPSEKKACPTGNPEDTDQSGCRTTVIIQRGATTVQIANEIDSRLLSFVSEVIRNAE